VAVAEHYIRPPLVAREPPSPAAARWRFRIVVGIVFIALIGGLAVLLFTVLLANNEGNPGINSPQGVSKPAGLAAASVTSLA
jgi:hypothetical protein